MGPAKVMGTFLRVWRSEWARLSRAQLAIALTAHLAKRRATTPRMVLHWEEGHPPYSAEELEALLKVMRGHGLIPCEVEQFRQAVFAACVDRQYPGLFGTHDWTRQDNLEAAAQTLHYQEANEGPPLNRVQVVSLMKQLESVLRGQRGVTVRGTQRRAQLAALAYLQRSLNFCHVVGGRPHVSAVSFAREAAFIETHFGRKGPGPTLTPARSRAFAARDRAMADGEPEGLWRVFEVSREAEALGECVDAAFIFFMGAVTSSFFGTAGQREYVRRRAARYIRPLGSDFEVAYCQFALCKVAVCDGLLGEAERYLEGFQEWEHGLGVDRGWWATTMGEFALASGNREEARRYFESALVVFRRLRDVLNEQYLLARVGACE